MNYKKFLPREGRLERELSTKTFNNIPKSETVQSIEITKLDDGTIAESDEYIKKEKQRKLDLLVKKYGNIDQNEITWVFVKRCSAG